MKLSKLYIESANRAHTFARLWGMTAILHLALVVFPGPIYIRILHGLVTSVFAFGTWLEWDTARLHRRIAEAHRRAGT